MREHLLLTSLESNPHLAFFHLHVTFPCSYLISKCTKENANCYSPEHLRSCFSKCCHFWHKYTHKSFLQDVPYLDSGFHVLRMKTHSQLSLPSLQDPARACLFSLISPFPQDAGLQPRGWPSAPPKRPALGNLLPSSPPLLLP